MISPLVYIFVYTIFIFKFLVDLATALPSQVAKLHNINRGDYIEISPIGTGEFKIKKIE